MNDRLKHSTLLCSDKDLDFLKREFQIQRIEEATRQAKEDNDFRQWQRKRDDKDYTDNLELRGDRRKGLTDW